MSSGGVVLLPAAVVVAAGAAVVIVAAAAVVLVVQAANVAAEGAVRAAGDYGAALEQQAAAQADAEVNAAVWQSVAAEVVELNARIRLLAERARRSGAGVALPAAVRIAGRSAAEVVAELRDARRQLIVAQQALHTAAIAGATVRLPAGAAQGLPDRAAVNTALLRYKRALESRLAVGAVPVARTAVTTGRAIGADEVAAVLSTLDPDAGETEQIEVLQAAARVQRDDPREAETYLLELQARIHRANARAAGQRLAAQRLLALEEPAVAQEIPPEPFAGTAARLRAVVAGDQEFTDELRKESHAAVDWAADVTRQHLVEHMFRQCLADDGYRVEGGFDVEHSSTLHLTREDWRGENSAEVWVDEEGIVNGRVLRHVQGLDDQSRARNQGRCNEFNATLEKIGAELGARVVINGEHAPQYLPSVTAPAEERIVQQHHQPQARERS